MSDAVHYFAVLWRPAVPHGAVSAVNEPLGPVAPISVNFNHQLAYFADQSDTTHVPHQPTTVA